MGNKFYNKIVWGNWPSNYADFCQTALNASSDGIILDAGCGSLVFTANTYAKSSNKLIVLLDRSMGMLQKGRERLIKANGSMPNHIILIQGDIFSLPFIDNAFDSVISQGLLHIFDEKETLLSELERVKIEEGRIFFTSLVGNNRFGKKYLSMLKNAGEVTTVHSSESLMQLLADMPFNYELTSIGNMAYVKNG